MTRLIRESHEVKYVQSYMHIHVGLARNASGEMFEAAYRCVQKLSESAPAQNLAETSKDGIYLESLGYDAVFDVLQPEIYGIAASGENDLAMTIARQTSGKDNDALFGALVRMMHVGHYAILGSKT